MKMMKYKGVTKNIYNVYNYCNLIYLNDLHKCSRIITIISARNPSAVVFWARAALQVLPVPWWANCRHNSYKHTPWFLC